MQGEFTVTEKPTLDLDSPTLAADVAGSLDTLGLATTANDPHKIVSVTVSDQAPDGQPFALYRTQKPHGLASSDIIVARVVSVEGYNGRMTVDFVPSPTTFGSADKLYSADATGGRWDRADA